MKYIFCLVTVFLIGLYNTASAQVNVPKLLADIKSAPNDSLKVEAYKRMYDYYQFVKPDSAKYYLNEGISYFTEKKSPESTAKLYIAIGHLESMQGRPEVAKVHYNTALKIFEDIEDHTGIALANNGLGVVEGRTGHYLPATRYFMTALHEFEKVNNTKGIINTYLKLGTVNDINGNLDKALEFFNKGLELSLKRPGDKNTAYLYNSIGVVYCKKQRSDTGLIFFQKGLELSQAYDMTETKVLTIMHMGNAYKDLEKFDKALECYYKALAFTTPEIMPENYARIKLNIATVKGLKDHNEALLLLREAEKIANDIGQRNLALEVLEEMINQYKLMGDYKSAFSTLEQANAIQDSLFTIDKNTEMANLQSVHELEKSNERVQQLESSEKSNRIQRNLIIFIACVLTLTIIVLAATYSRTRNLNKKLLKSESELQRSSSIKDRIFSIIGHDLRGPIANIPMVIELYKDPRTTENEKEYMLDLLTENSMASLETLDKLLHWGKSQIKGIAIQQKQFRASQNLQHQVSLIKGIANNKGVIIKNNVPSDTVIFADEDHFNFIVRNLLSNAIKFSHKDSNVIIDADRYSRPGFTVFSVQDTGVGISKEQQIKIFEAFGSSTLGTNNEGGTSIGLMLCKEFVRENGGNIWVESEQDKGATFFFTFKSSQV